MTTPAFVTRSFALFTCSSTVEIRLGGLTEFALAFDDRVDASSTLVAMNFSLQNQYNDTVFERQYSIMQGG